MQLTSNAVPFGSTYRIKYKKNSYDRSAEIENYAFRNGIDYKVKYNKNLDGQVTSASGVIKCEDYKDFEVENFLSRKGIDYRKRTICSRCGEERILSKCKKTHFFVKMGRKSLLEAISLPTFSTICSRRLSALPYAAVLLRSRTCS